MGNGNNRQNKKENNNSVSIMPEIIESRHKIESEEMQDKWDAICKIKYKEKDVTWFFLN